LDVQAAIISRQPLRPFCRGACPAAHAAAPSVADVRRAPVTLLPPDHGIRQMLSVSSDGGFRLTSRLETGSFEIATSLRVRRMGVAFLPDFVVAAELQGGFTCGRCAH